MPSSSTFRIAHLSDLHLTEDDKARRSAPKLFGRLRGMNAAFRQIVRVTGHFKTGQGGSLQNRPVQVSCSGLH